MNKLLCLYQTFCVVLLVSTVSACAQFDNFNGQPQWDFDHKVQYRQSKLAENYYHLEIVATGKTNFKTLATFLLRHASELCRTEQFDIEIKQGIESYTHKQSFPNMISNDLIANIRCPS